MGRCKETGIVCSCGRAAVIRWSERLGRYYARSRDWRFHSNARDENKSRLWHCGRRGHYQLTPCSPDRVADRRMMFLVAVTLGPADALPRLAGRCSRRMWDYLNDLRHYLIDKSVYGFLYDDERRRLDRLQQFADLYVEHRHPSPPLPAIPGEG